MIYLDNIIFSLQKHGGVSVVWGELIKNIQKSNLDVHFLEYNNSYFNGVRNKIKIDNNKIQLLPSNYININRYFNPNIKSDNPYIFHSSYYRFSMNPRALNITTVHDFTYEKFRKGLGLTIHHWQKSKAINNSDAVVCISNNTYDDLLDYFPKIDKSKVFIINNGVSNDYKILGHKPYNYEDYILFVGAREGYKNFDFVVESLKDTKYKLLICGAPLNLKELDLLDKHLEHNHFKSIVFPSNEELNRIYNSVNCLVYPSSYEGFGIPILEAQKAGCPVIALNSSSIPEVIGSSNMLLNNLKTNELLSKLDIIKNKSIRSEIIEDGLINSSKYSWERMGKEYLELYKSFNL